MDLWVAFLVKESYFHLQQFQRPEVRNQAVFRATPTPIAWEKECHSFPLVASDDFMFSLVCGCLRLPLSPRGLLLCVHVFHKDTVIGFRAFSNPDLSHLEIFNLIHLQRVSNDLLVIKKHREYSVFILPDIISICLG